MLNPKDESIQIVEMEDGLFEEGFYSLYEGEDDALHAEIAYDLLEEDYMILDQYRKLSK